MRRDVSTPLGERHRNIYENELETIKTIFKKDDACNTHLKSSVRGSTQQL